MNKLRYEKPLAEIVEFDTSDVVVVASGDIGGGDSGNRTSWFCVFKLGSGEGNVCDITWLGPIGLTSL